MPTPYRDDADALKARHAQLVEELAAIEERVGELSALQQAQQRLEQELSTVRQRLDGITARRVPLLDSLRVASPCTASWDEMAGDDRVRFCQRCEKNVYNLSEMPRDEAERLVRAAAGDLCVRLYQRADGTVLTADCPVGVSRRRIRNLTAAAVGGGLLAAGMALASASSSSRAVLGGLAPPRAVAPDIGPKPDIGLMPPQTVPRPGASDRTVMSIADRPASPGAPAPAAEAPPGLEEAPAEPAATAPKAAPPRRGVAPGAKAPCGCAAGDPLCTCL
ncbi:cell division protein ZapB [Sorangium sp. So ce216]